MAVTWQDRVKTDFVIQTGDKARFVPLWFSASARHSVRYNVSKFEFKGIQGSLVKRGTSQGQEYDIEIVFHGGDNIEQAKAFKKSADNPGAWTITHPMYERLYVQPVDEFRYDNGRLNQTVISGTVIETLLDSGVAPTLDPVVVVAQLAKVANQNLNDTYVSYNSVVSANSLQSMLSSVNSIYRSVSAKIANVQSTVTLYRNLYNQTISTLLLPITATSFALNAITAVQGMYIAPASFVDTVVNRLNMLKLQFDIINENVPAILRIPFVNTRSLKKLYENNAGSIISAMCEAAFTNIGDDYLYRPDVLSIISTIAQNYNTFLANIVSLQTANGGQTNSYIPDPNAIQSLQNCVYSTIQNLFSISAGALQARTYVLPYDDNLINVTYLLYGSDPDDSKKMTLMANNNIGLDEILILRQGRKILYYV